MRNLRRNKKERMGRMKRVPISEAKSIGKKLGMVRVVLVLHEPSGGMHVVTWGKSYDDCVKAAYIGNCIKSLVLRREMIV